MNEQPDYTSRLLARNRIFGADSISVSKNWICIHSATSNSNIFDGDPFYPVLSEVLCELVEGGNFAEDGISAHMLDIATFYPVESVDLFPLGPQEPPNDPRIFNRRQPDGTYRPLSEFFDKPFQRPTDEDRDDQQTASDAQYTDAAEVAPPDASDAASFEIDDLVGIGDDVTMRGSNGIRYEGIALDVDAVEMKVKARVWDNEVRSPYTAWWGLHHLIEVNGRALVSHASA